MRGVVCILLTVALAACSVTADQAQGGPAGTTGREIPAGAEPPTAPASLCVDRKIVLENAAGERAETERTSTGSSLGGGLVIRGKDGSFVKIGNTDVVSDGMTAYGPALFKASFPSGGSSLYCANATTAVTNDGDQTFRMSLRGVSPITDCEAGTPVEGSITICQSREGQLCPASEITGTVEGQPVKSKTSGYSSSDLSFTPHVDERGIVEVDLDGDTVTGALVFFQDAAGGGVYCATSGTKAEQGEGLRREVRIELTGLRRLGACPLGAADATVVEACAR